MNRIAAQIANVEKIIADKTASGARTAEQNEKDAKSLDIELRDFCTFQEMKSIASTDGTLSLEEGMTVYRYLGSTPETFNKQSFAVKYVLTQLLGELAQKFARQRGAAVPA